MHTFALRPAGELAATGGAASFKAAHRRQDIAGSVHQDCKATRGYLIMAAHKTQDIAESVRQDRNKPGGSVEEAAFAGL
jgi:hypothetical protein